MQLRVSGVDASINDGYPDCAGALGEVPCFRGPYILVSPLIYEKWVAGDPAGINDLVVLDGLHVGVLLKVPLLLLQGLLSGLLVLLVLYFGERDELHLYFGEVLFDLPSYRFGRLFYGLLRSPPFVGDEQLARGDGVAVRVLVEEGF